MVFERDVAIRMVLIDETEDIIFLDAETDPYTDGSNLGSAFSENALVIENRISRDNFEIGHVFIANCSTGGGAVGLAAFGSACEGNRSRGSSCQFYNDSRFAVELVCHEMGHQLAASHSWGNCPGNDGQISTGTAFEPGSGSTIMSYSGACGSDNNIQRVADDYFHSGNVEQMIEEKLRESSCANVIPTNNNHPIISSSYTDGFFIPIGTPFELKGAATDEDGDVLTYCWEQMNTGPATPLGNPVRTAPIFRSFSPTTTPNRSFPRSVDLINNRSTNYEVLPTYTRNLKFRLTVRDNNAEAGGIDWEDVSFEATEEAGPFLVTFPNRVADGSQSVTIPDVLSDRARIRIEAADNIFYDISNQDISIISPTSAGFSFATSIQTQQVCLPATVDIDLSTFSLLGFDQPISFVGPTSATDAFSTSFSNEAINPGMDNQFSITFPADYPGGEFSFDIKGIAEGLDTVSRSIILDLVPNQFTDLALTEPINNTSGVGLPFFQWSGDEDANLYEIDIATNPAFGDFIVDSGTNLIGTSYTPTITLDQSTIYYWRVRPINECGVGTNSETFAFQTQNLTCTSENATEVPLNISMIG